MTFSDLTGPDYCIAGARDYVGKAIAALELAESWGAKVAVDIALLKAIKKGLYDAVQDEEHDVQGG